MMKRLCFNTIAIMVLVAPLLMATRCTVPLPEHTNEDENCEIDCKVWVKYVDENGQRIKFGESEYFQTCQLLRAECEDWVDLQTQSSLDYHNDDHRYFPHPPSNPDSAHCWVLAAPARDSLTHQKVKAKLRTELLSYNVDKYVGVLLYDEIEVEFHYATPDKAYIKLIKINGEVKWDRSKASEEELSKDISIDFYLDKDRLKEYIEGLL